MSNRGRSGGGLRLVIDKRFPDEHMEYLLQECGGDCVVLAEQGYDDLTADVRLSRNALLWYGHAPVDAALLEKFPNVRVVSNFGAGYEHVRCADAIERGILVGHTPGFSLAKTTADLAIALAVASARNIVPGTARAAKGVLEPNWIGKEFSGATIGVVGMGNIGTEVAHRAAGFGMRILYHNRRRKPEENELLLGGYSKAHFYPTLKGLLEASDFVVLSCPVSPSTVGMMALEQFRCMRKDAVLINVARGAVVNTDDMVQALRERPNLRCAMDVTEPEPLPVDHALFTDANIKDRVVITPHIGSATSGTRLRMLQMAVANAKAAVEGQPLPHPVKESEALNSQSKN